MKQPDIGIVEELDPFMKSHGFGFIGSRGGYYRKYKGGFDYLGWGSYPSTSDEKWAAGYYEGHYGIGLRNNAIDDVLKAAISVYGTGNQEYATTVYRAVGWVGNYFAFDPVRDRELFLRFDHLEEDIVELVRRIEAMLVNDGFSWYQRYADPAMLSRDINEPIDLLAGPHPLVNNSEQRPLVGVAAACVGEPRRVPELVDAYLEQARRLDQRAMETGGERFASKLNSQLQMIVARALELGYPVKIR